MSADMDDLDRELAQIEAGDRQSLRSSFTGMGARFVTITLATLAIIVFGAIIWYAYSEGVLSGSEGAAPLLRPDGPAKIQPDDPGGLEIPHQDKLVYNTVNKNSGDAKVERLIPPPEPPKILPRYPDAEQTPQNAENFENSTASTTPAIVAVPPANTLETTQETTQETVSKNLPEVAQDTREDTEPTLLSAPDATATGTVAQTNPAPPAKVNLVPNATIAVVKPANPAPKPTEKQQPQPTPTQTKQPETKPDTKPKKIKPVSIPKKQDATALAFWRIQIASLNSEAAAQKQWATYQKQIPSLLGKMPLTIQKAVVKGRTYYRIQAGRLPSRQVATDTCNRVKQAGLSCIVVKP